MKYIMTFLFFSICCNYSFASETYKVRIHIFHNNELIAQPDMKVNSGDVSKVKVSLPGQEKYECSVLISTSDKAKVDVSIKFTSGKLVFTPEFSGVVLGKETTASINSFRVKLLVE